MCDISKRRAGRYHAGFFTEEVRVAGERQGFDVVTLDGQRGVLARAGLGPKVNGPVHHCVQATEVLLWSQTSLLMRWL